MKNKIFLSIETSLNRIFLVLFYDGQLFYVSKNVQNSIEVDLNYLIKDLFDKNKVKFSELDFVLVSLGPGSYTGARVGIAAAKAIALSIEKPVLGYSNFETLFAEACLKKYITDNSVVGMVLKANSNKLYYQKIDRLQRKEIKVIGLNVLLKKNTLPKIVVGNLKENFNFNKYFYCKPSERSKLIVFKKLYHNYKSGIIDQINPYYIGGHYAEKNNVRC